VGLYGRYLRDVLGHALDKTSVFATLVYLVLAGVVAIAAKLGNQIESSTIGDITFKATVGWLAFDILILAPARVAVGYVRSAQTNQRGVTVNVGQIVKIVNFGNPPSSTPTLPTLPGGATSHTDDGEIDWAKVKVVSGRRVHLDSQRLPLTRRIDGVTFLECEIVGPVVIHAIDSEIDAKDDQDVSRLLLGPRPAGADGYLYVTDCIFRSCRFRQVRFVSPPNQNVTVS
jgi:hypothetical protein